jgi:hypothetical protein
MAYSKGTEMFSEAIPGLVIQAVALLTSKEKSLVAVGSLFVSAATTAMTAASSFYDIDTDPGGRKRNPDLTGLIPDQARGKAFLVLLALSFWQVLAKGVATALLAVTDVRTLLYYVVCDVGLSLAYKVATNDFHAIFALPWAASLVCSTVARIMYKVITDFTGTRTRNAHRGPGCFARAPPPPWRKRASEGVGGQPKSILLRRKRAVSRGGWRGHERSERNRKASFCGGSGLFRSGVGWGTSAASVLLRRKRAVSLGGCLRETPRTPPCGRRGRTGVGEVVVVCRSLSPRAGSPLYRIPQLLGGTTYSFTLVTSQISVLVAVHLYNKNFEPGEGQEKLDASSVWQAATTMVIAWVCLFSYFVLRIAVPKKRWTLWSSKTGRHYVIESYTKSESDEKKFDIFRRNKILWEKEIGGQVREWTMANWAAWERDKPEWLNPKVKSSVPDSYIPGEFLAGLGGANRVRRGSAAGSVRESLRAVSVREDAEE